MSVECTFTVPKSLWLSMNDRYHRMEEARRTRALRLLGRACGIPPQDVTHVAAFVAYPRNGRADPGNGYPTFKALIDGMTDAGVWPDDDDTHVIGPTPLRDPATKKPGIYRVRFVLTPQQIPW